MSSLSRFAGRGMAVLVAAGAVSALSVGFLWRSPAATAEPQAAPAAPAEAKPKASEAKPVADDAALERARETTKMLDTLYKTAVVSITSNYVSARGSKPAAQTVKPVFEAMAKNGFHTVRLIDVTGEPFNAENVAKDAFEKAAFFQIVTGAASFEEVETVGDKRFLRTATVVPVVMKECRVCHVGQKLNAPIGALVYRVPVK